MEAKKSGKRTRSMGYDSRSTKQEPTNMFLIFVWVVAVYIYIIMVNEGNYPQMALIQVCEIL